MTDGRKHRNLRVVESKNTSGGKILRGEGGSENTEIQQEFLQRCLWLFEQQPQ